MQASTMAEVFGAPIIVLVGHAGTGKTNTALGLALALAHEGYEVTLADLDVVNPYFRSSDYPQLLEQAHIRLIAPVMARTTLDTPSLTGELDVAIEQTAGSPNRRLIIDVGGDDDGAITIGRWSERLKAAGAQVLYVVSAYRSLTPVPEDAAAMLPDIEWTSRLKATGVLNASNLSDETTSSHVRHGREFALKTADLLGLPLTATVVPLAAATKLDITNLPADVHNYATIAPPSVTEALIEGISDPEPLVLMPRLVRTPWDS
ncbi:MAG: hypothetical protein IKG11_02825 [Atopobiaceae bacterium]|nr:hypothetical protein [Atopobiaceae bacterium]